MTKEYFLFWPDEPTLENLQSAYVNLDTHFSICLPNLRDYYRAEADAKKMTYEQLAKTVRIESRKHMIGRFYCHCGKDEPFAPFTEEDAKRADEYNQGMQEFCKINRQSPKCSGCSADMEIFLLTSHGMVWLDTGNFKGHDTKISSSNSL